MTQDPCARLRRWLAAGADHSGLPDQELAAHVADCPRCRGALAVLLVQLVGAPAADGLACDACAADLPAYIELEHEQDLAAAARSFPQIWWHLWTCPDCLESAESLRHLVAAEAAGQISAPPAPVSMRPPALPTLRLDRAFLHAVFGQQAALGATWHDGDDPLFLAERALPGYRIVLSVQQRAGDQWDLEVTVEPPVLGVVVVRFGETSFRSALRDGHTALIRALPTALLADRSGPDMQVTVERERGDLRAG